MNTNQSDMTTKNHPWSPSDKNMTVIFADGQIDKSSTKLLPFFFFFSWEWEMNKYGWKRKWLLKKIKKLKFGQWVGGEKKEKQ